MTRHWHEGYLKPCGTPAAYRRHLRRGEKACRSCLQAAARYKADQRERPPSPELITKARRHANALLALAGKADATRLGHELGVGNSTVYRWRRALLHALAETRAVVHWQKPGTAPGTASCHFKVTRALVTPHPEYVTCGSCQQSRAWQAAA